MMKQVIVMRKDLGMRAGKMVAQGAHASMKVLLEHRDHVAEHSAWLAEWLEGSFTKVCVRVESEQELLLAYSTAQHLGLPCALITDNGTTEFNGVKTNTCIAVGPGPEELVDQVTGEMRLL